MKTNLRDKKLFIFDMDGVLYRETEPITTGINAVNKLQEMGKKVAFLTNNSTKTSETYSEKLNKMGMKTTPDQIFTSANIAVNHLEPLYPKGTVFVIGEQGLKTVFESKGFTILNDKHPEIDTFKLLPPEIRADFVIVGLDWTATYNKLRTGMMLINNGAHFYATNDDANFPVPGTLWPGAGALVSFLATACLKQPELIFGKPYLFGSQAILAHFDMKKEDSVMIGDRLSTDVVLGNNAGMVSICVGTGVSTRKEAERAKPPQKPNFYFETLDEMFEKHF
jgi:HAD superfamily hydrolase (TIGR01450 family)